MDLQEIVKRYAEGLQAIDREVLVGRANQRTGVVYMPGLKSMLEREVVGKLDDWWVRAYPSEIGDPLAHAVEVPMSDTGKVNCDHVFTTDGEYTNPEWAIEIKYLQLVGDNGKRNDFAVTKALSPYLKDRSLHHDILKLRRYPIARRLGVVGISFTHNEETCEEAYERFPNESVRIDEVVKTCVSNEGSLSPRPLVEFADGIFGVKELVMGHYVKADFTAWRHPCGGRGVVFGWEVKREDHHYSPSEW